MNKNSQHLHCCSLVPRTGLGYILVSTKLQLREETFSITMQRASGGRRILVPLKICQFLTCSPIIKLSCSPLTSLAPPQTGRAELYQELKWVLILEQHDFMLLVWWDETNNAVYFSKSFGALYQTYWISFQVLYTSYCALLETGYC